MNVRPLSARFSVNVRSPRRKAGMTLPSLKMRDDAVLGSIPKAEQYAVTTDVNEVVNMSGSIGFKTVYVNGFKTDFYGSHSRLIYRAMGHDLLARIDKRLEAVGLSESRAPQLAGMSDSAIRNLRRDLAAGKQRSMNTGTLGKLAPVLKTTVQWLLTGAGVEDTREPATEPRAGLSIGDEWRARLADAIEKDGRLHAEIETTLGLPARYLIHLTEGGGNPTLQELDAICSALGISFSQLVFGVDVTLKQVEFWRLLQEVNPEAQDAMLTFLRGVPRGGKPPTP